MPWHPQIAYSRFASIRNLRVLLCRIEIQFMLLHWRKDSKVTLSCSLDRIFDDAVVYKLRGKSCRGKKLETVTVEVGTPGGSAERSTRTE